MFLFKDKFNLCITPLRKDFINFLTYIALTSDHIVTPWYVDAMYDEWAYPELEHQLYKDGISFNKRKIPQIVQ